MASDQQSSSLSEVELVIRRAGGPSALWDVELGTLSDVELGTLWGVKLGTLWGDELTLW